MSDKQSKAESEKGKLWARPLVRGALVPRAACDLQHAERRIYADGRESEFAITSDPTTGPTTHIQKSGPGWDRCERERAPKSAKLQIVDELVEPCGS